MLTPSLPTEAPTGLPLSARRRIQSGLIAASAAGAPRTGILTASTPLLVTGTADTSMRYRIAPFVGASSRDGVGVEFVANDASDTAGTDVAPSSNSRIDVIWFRSRFPSLTDTGQTAPLFGVTRGTPNANPQKPTNIPPGAEELATAVVTSTDLTTQTVVITNTFRWTALAGGVVPLRSKAEMDAWAPAEGALAYRMDTKETWQRVSGAWAVLLRPTSGWTTLSLTDGWSNFGSGYPSLRVRLDMVGNVHIQGQVLARSGYPSAEVFATLPEGMRPSARIAVPVLNNFSSTAAIAGVLIDTNGNMNVTQAGVGTFSFGNTVIAPV
jgi:hypothetical protein